MPSRTIWWSSASKTCTGISLLQWYFHVQSGPLTRRRENLTGAAKNLQALLDAQQPESSGNLARRDTARIEACPVVLDRAARKPLNPPKADFRGPGLRVFR